MALSDHERRALDDIDLALSTDDPLLADALRRARWPSWTLRNRSRRLRHLPHLVGHSRTTVLLTTLGMLLAGLALVFGGLLVDSGPGAVLAVIGYAVTVASSYLANASLRRRRRD